MATHGLCYVVAEHDRRDKEDRPRFLLKPKKVQDASKKYIGITCFVRRGFKRL
jgi:hypothetical protein